MAIVTIVCSFKNYTFRCYRLFEITRKPGGKDLHSVPPPTVSYQNGSKEADDKKIHLTKGQNIQKKNTGTLRYLLTIDLHRN